MFTIYNREITQEDMNTIATYMDDEIRENLHLKIAPCTPNQFLIAYITEDPDFMEFLENEFQARDNGILRKVKPLYNPNGAKYGLYDIENDSINEKYDTLEEAKEEALLLSINAKEETDSKYFEIVELI